VRPNATEALFHADSPAAVGLLRAVRSKTWPHDGVALAALCASFVHRHLNRLGLETVKH
jgi:hypothetical protein